jgi:hypothetical protein
MHHTHICGLKAITAVLTEVVLARVTDVSKVKYGTGSMVGRWSVNGQWMVNVLMLDEGGVVARS